MRLLSDFVGKRVSETRRDARSENPLRKLALVLPLVPGDTEVAGLHEKRQRDVHLECLSSCRGRYALSFAAGRMLLPSRNRKHLLPYEHEKMISLLNKTRRLDLLDCPCECLQVD